MGNAVAIGEVVTTTLPATLTEKLVSNLNLAANLQYNGQRWYDAGLSLHLQPSPFRGAPAGSGSLGMAGLSGGHAYIPRISSNGSGGLDLLSNPLFTFALNKALISTGLKEPLPPGLAEYRIARHVMPILRNTPDFVTWGWGYERILTNYAIGSFHPRGETRIVSRSVWVEDKLGFKLWGSFPTQQTRTFGFETIIPIEYEGFRDTFGLGKLVRNIPLEGPLFVLDVAFNGYFQYQADADLPGGIWGLRGRRAIAGGAGNAVISGVITGIGGLAIARTCVGTGPACPIALGVLTLTADFTANLAFDQRGKEPLLEFFGLGRPSKTE